MKVPFNSPSIEGRELEYIGDAVQSQVTAAGGKYCRRAQALLSEMLGGPEVLVTTSCTAALEMVALLLNLGPKDSVIVPSFTFVTTALAFARTGARIKFADIEPVTLGIDPESVSELLDDSVKAVVPVHYAGVACDLTGLKTVLSETPDVHIVEDNAHGLLGTYRQIPLGTFGRFSTLSFHETKNIICGEGGAIVLNDPSDVDRARMIYHKGTDRQAFLEGRTDSYTWRDTGSSFGLSDLLAAYLTGQLEQADSIIARRRAAFEAYSDQFEPVANELRFSTPTIPPDRESAYHMYYLMMPDRATRDHVLEKTNSVGLTTAFHYIPLHSSPAAAKFAPGTWNCPVSTDVSGRILRLPYFNSISYDDTTLVVDTVVEALRSYAGG